MDADCVECASRKTGKLHKYRLVVVPSTSGPRSPVTRGSNLEKHGNFYLMIDFGSQGVPKWESDGCHSGIFEHFFQEALNLSLRLQKLKKSNFKLFTIILPVYQILI